MSDEQRQPAIEIAGEPLKALYIYLKQHEDDLNRENFATLNRIERVIFQHLSIEEVEQLIAERSPQRGTG